MEARATCRSFQQQQQSEAALDQVHVFRLRDLRQAHVRPGAHRTTEDRQTADFQWQAEHGRTHRFFQKQDRNHWR